MRQYRIFPDKKCVNLNKISDPTKINPKYISILCSEFYYKHQSFIDLLFLIFHDIQDLVCIIASNSKLVKYFFAPSLNLRSATTLNTASSGKTI